MGTHLTKVFILKRNNKDKIQEGCYIQGGRAGGGDENIGFYNLLSIVLGSLVASGMCVIEGIRSKGMNEPKVIGKNDH